MGTQQGWQYEWIELYNNTNKEIDIKNWKIKNGKAKKETLDIDAGKIKAKDYFLICRKQMTGIKEKCDMEISKMSLNNDYQKNGRLVLIDEQGNIIDQTPKSNDKKWHSGDNLSKQTMERKNSCVSGLDNENWQTSKQINGTPKAKNSIIIADLPLIKNEDISKETEEQKNKTQTIIYPSEIYINEILPCPEGSDAENEWIELFNKNTFEVDISEWKITDIKGKTFSYVFPKATKIPGKKFLVLTRQETKITLNNSGDGLKLIQPDGKIINEVVFEKTFLGKSYNRTETDKWEWSETLTPDSLNIISESEAKENLFFNDYPAKTETIQNSFDLEQEQEQEQTKFFAKNPLMRDLKQNKTVKSFPDVFIASMLAIFSGAIIFALKKETQKLK